MNFLIKNLERNLPDGVVVTAHWTAKKSDGDYSASTYGSVGLPEKDPKSKGFIKFDKLTESQVIEWVKAALGEEAVAAIESGLDAQIEAQKKPVSASGVPWAEAEQPED